MQSEVEQDSENSTSTHENKKKKKKGKAKNKEQKEDNSNSHHVLAIVDSSNDSCLIDQQYRIEGQNHLRII